MALTFDDGPSPTFTPAILDILAEEGACATFFCVADHARARPDLVARMTAEGHSVGSHGARHCDLGSIGGRELAADLRGARDTLQAITGQRVDLYRPPHGHVDARVGAITHWLRMTTWLWSIDPEDWRPEADPAGIVEACESASGGDVIVLHDGLEEPWHPAALDRAGTVEALPRIIRSARARGLSFRRLER